MLRDSMKSMFRLPWTVVSSGVRGRTGQTDNTSDTNPMEPLLDLGDRVVDQMLDLMLIAVPGDRQGQHQADEPGADWRPAQTHDSGAGVHSTPGAAPSASPATPGAAPPPGAATAPTGTAPAPAAPAKRPPLKRDPWPISASQRGLLDPSRLVVMGEGLAAGMGEFSVAERYQHGSFPALVAQHLGTSLRQPLAQNPGIGRMESFVPTSVRYPQNLQTTVLRDFPPASPPDNLSVPGFTVSDAVRLRPAAPLIRLDDEKQSTANLILGLPGLEGSTKKPLATQLEMALRKRPTLVLIELGYFDAIVAFMGGSKSCELTSFHEDYRTILQGFADTNAQVVVMTIPDPLDSAFYSSWETAAEILKVEPDVLSRAYGIGRGDYVTPHGLMEIGNQLLEGSYAPLAGNAILPAAVARKASHKVAELNGVLGELAAEHSVPSYPLAGFLKQVAAEGVHVGTRHITADYLGGFYGMNGLYPGLTGQALIANDLLEMLNSHYSASFPLVDVTPVLADDPVAEMRPAEGPARSWDSLNLKTRAAPAEVETAVEYVPRHSPPQQHCDQDSDEPLVEPLRLPDGFEQVLPITTALSYHGDGMRLVDCQYPEQMQFGDCNSVLFGGLALFSSHLSGSLRIRFSPPQNDWTTFEVNIVDGALQAPNGSLATPKFYRFPLLEPKVVQPHQVVSGGRLNLRTGQVVDLKFNLFFVNSGLQVLLKLNPTFPSAPIAFPGVYGSAWARFTQRPDGLLDFEFQGTTFGPLGDNIRYPFPFASATDDYATFPANGTALHPNIHLSTVEVEAVKTKAPAPEIPVNRTVELSLATNKSSFGDDFTLNSPNLGIARGRSYLTGRLQMQFGEQSGGTVPYNVAFLPPAGLLEDPNYEPLQKLFPAKLPPGFLGHDGILKFPIRTYGLNTVYLLDDRFDLAQGAIDVKSGKVLGNLLDRGFIGQDLISALFRVEPKTPKNSFYFRGPAAFSRGANGELRYDYDAAVLVPYPPGFLFPQPDLASGFVIGPDSRLDPFAQLSGVGASVSRNAFKSGSASKILSATLETFSYKYSVAADPRRRRSYFEYTNHSLDATFTMTQLSAVSFFNSGRGDSSRTSFDTVAFTAFGVWSKRPNEIHNAIAQFSTEPNLPYVSILIGGGNISNANVLPPKQIPPLRPIP